MEDSWSRSIMGMVGLRTAGSRGGEEGTEGRRAGPFAKGFPSGLWRILGSNRCLERAVHEMGSVESIWTSDASNIL